MTKTRITARLGRASAAVAVAAICALGGCASDPDQSSNSSGRYGAGYDTTGTGQARTAASSTTDGRGTVRASTDTGGTRSARAADTGDRTTDAGGTAYYDADRGGGSARSGGAANQAMQMAFPTGDRQTSALLLEKQMPAQIRLNREFDYQLKVTNLTDQTLSDVAINEQTPDNFRIVSASGEGATTRPAQQGSGNVYHLGSLGPNEARTITVRGTATGAGNLSSCTTVSYSPSLCTAMAVINPQIRLSKTGPDRADICEEIVYTYRVTNDGTGTESNVVIEDQLPEGLMTIDGNRSLKIDVGELAAGDTREFQARLKAERTGQYASQALVRTPVDQMQSESVSTTVVAPSLALDLSGPQEEFLGKPVQYRLTVTNNGDAPARDATVQVQGVGDQVALAPADGNDAQLASGRMTGGSADGMSLGTIEPGQSRTYTLTVNPQQQGDLNVRATANAVCVEQPAVATVQTAVRGIPALLLEVVDREDPVRVGLDTIYKIDVKNQGSALDRNIQLNATLPAEVEFITATGPTRVRADGNRLTFDPLPQLGPNEVATWEIQVKANNPAAVQFQVDMKSDSLPQAANETEPTRLY